jgi:periplasmic protein CpxP/Spy
MDKTKLLTVAVIALLLLNFGVLGFLFLSKEKQNRPENRPRPREVVIEKLGFNAKQIADYEKLIQIHRQGINAIDDSIRDTKNKMYELLNSETTTKKDSLISKIASYQTQIETLNFNHFLDIKKLCTKEQAAKFKDLTVELTRIFSKKQKPRHD